MEETKKHEHACCGGHGKETTGCCSCLDKPWMRILILFCAALVIFFMGICVASRTNDRFEGGRSCGQRFSENNGGCPMLNADTLPTGAVSTTNATPSSTCGQEKNGGCPMRQAE